jgi:hypothetical protein
MRRLPRGTSLWVTHPASTRTGMFARVHAFWDRHFWWKWLAIWVAVLTGFVLVWTST